MAYIYRKGYLGRVMKHSSMIGLSHWQEATPALVGRIGSPGLPSALDAALRQVAPFDLSCIFAYPGRATPLFLHDGLGEVASPQIMSNYLNGTYLLDAVYTAAAHQTPAGLYRLKALAPDAFFEGEYYNSPDVHPCISMESGSLAEEIVFLAPIDGPVYLAYSLLRRNGSPEFSSDDFARLQGTAPMVLALLAQNWRHLASPQGQPASVPRKDHDDIEQAFGTFAPTKLTAREQTIVSLILRGHSSISIGKLLDIAEGTVKIHRRNIYAKLAISSQTELFNLFIQHLLARK